MHVGDRIQEMFHMGIYRYYCANASMLLRSLTLSKIVVTSVELKFHFVFLIDFQQK